MKLYPNPVSDILTLEIEPAIADGPITVALYNTMGQIEKTLMVSPDAGRTDISLQGLGKGIYILTISTKKFKTSRKVVKL